MIVMVTNEYVSGVFEVVDGRAVGLRRARYGRRALRRTG